MSARRRIRRAPRVSVIMPVFNAAESLTTAVRSVLRQRMADLELIIVDDASTDDSRRIAARLAREDCRIRCLELPRNRGQAAARNLAIEHAQGAWIAPVDADDEITEDRFDVLCRATEGRHISLVADSVVFAAPGDRHPEDTRPATQGNGGATRLLSAQALIRSDIPLNGRRSFGYLKPLMHREFLERCRLRYDEDLRFAEDLNLYVRAVMCGGRFMLHPEAHYIYNQTPVSASRDIRVLPGVAEHALLNNARLQALAGSHRMRGLEALLKDHAQRWTTVLWFNRIKLALRTGRLNDAVRMTLDCPSSLPAVVRFARDRLRNKRDQAQTYNA